MNNLDELYRLVRMYKAIILGQNDLREEFSRQWNGLPEQKRVELVRLLLKAGLLSPQVGHAMKIFNATVVSLL